MPLKPGDTISIEITIPDGVVVDEPTGPNPPLTSEEEESLSQDLVHLQQELYGENDGTEEVHFLIQHALSPAMGDASMAMAGFARGGAVDGNRLRRAVQRLRDAIHHVKWFKQDVESKLNVIAKGRVKAAQKGVRIKLRKVIDELKVLRATDEEKSLDHPDFAGLRYKGTVFGLLRDMGEVNKQHLAMMFLATDGALDFPRFREAYEAALSEVK